ncbi:protein YgfX [Yersinia ruckeri]|uniref:protein YgfX n=1 Tax=Yersinia ruckeri TaxID=29486 RepID=UPI00223861D8|nr:protein YgfX [Yersinia ruckeri]EKN4699813.1 protein YgfX [Yersinia ruckeri]MCW6564633.1 protein YgfX [Yersinia ruckeri]MCW6576061.1 protein YgfX [Yersinia ruckeri]MCW6585444.1 protein YgfX [Yersinia ruckeri]MCW6601507.1 protein YgfX [Yersinia ruckeri]
MAQWRCDLRVSWRTQLFSLLVHGVLVLLTLVVPWPDGFTPLWLILLTLVVFECIRSQKNITSRQGEIRLKAGNLLIWKWQEWTLVRPPWITRYGVLLSLQGAGSRRRKRIWLASDSMSEEKWRELCLILRHTFDFAAGRE